MAVHVPLVAMDFTGMVRPFVKLAYGIAKLALMALHVTLLAMDIMGMVLPL